MIKVIILFVCLLASSPGYADGFCGSSWGVRVILKNGTLKSGYISWCDNFRYFDDDFFSFNYLRNPKSKNYQIVSTYPRKNEVPANGCYQCDEKIFRLWIDYANWCIAKGIRGSLGHGINFDLFDIAVITSPVTVTAVVKDSAVVIPLEQIKKIEMDPEKSLRVSTCLTSITRREVELLKDGKLLHVVIDFNSEGSGSTLFFYDPRVTPEDWLKDMCSKNSDIDTTIMVDGHPLWRKNTQAYPLPKEYRPGDFPDTPLFRSMAETIKKKVWQVNNLRGDMKKYDEFGKKYFAPLTEGEKTKIVNVSADCD